MGISINGPSGIDTQYIIDSLVGIEREKITRVEGDRSAYQVKIDAYSKLKSYLTEIRSKATALGKLSSFDLFTTTSTNDKAVTVKGGAGSVDSQHDIKVFQLAASEKMISADGRITDQDASLSSLGVGVGEISVDGVNITIGATDTIQDLRMKINNATDSSGNKLDVTASVLKISDNNFRLVLTSRNTGSEGIEYKDISGTTLQDLGIIASADGDKGSSNQTLTSADNVLSAFEALGVGEAVQFTGTDRDGRSVTAAFVKTASSTSDDFLNAVSSAYNNMVNASFDASGNLVIEDKVSGKSALGMSSLSVGSTSLDMDVSEIGVDGSGVLSAGKDAYFSVDNITMSSSTNSAEGFVTGATFELHSVSVESVTVTMSRDLDGIKKKFQELIDSYNALVRFSKESTKVADPKDEKSKSGDLAGDMTVKTILSQVRSFFQQGFDQFGGTYTNFAMVGLKTDTATGEYTINDEKFKEALEKGLDEVMRLFTTTGFSENSAVTLGRNTADTTSGKYRIEEVDANHFRIQLAGSSEWFTSDTREGDIISFSSGPAKGMMLTAPAGAVGTGVAFTFQKGLSGLIDEGINSLTDSREGLVSMRQESWRKSIQYSDERITKLEDRIEKYRLRLVKQFSDMEQAMSLLQSQSSKMLSSLGAN